MRVAADEVGWQRAGERAGGVGHITWAQFPWKTSSFRWDTPFQSETTAALATIAAPTYWKLHVIDVLLRVTQRHYTVLAYCSGSSRCLVLRCDSTPHANTRKLYAYSCLHVEPTVICYLKETELHPSGASLLQSGESYPQESGNWFKAKKIWQRKPDFT